MPGVDGMPSYWETRAMYLSYQHEATKAASVRLWKWVKRNRFWLILLSAIILLTIGQMVIDGTVVFPCLFMAGGEGACGGGP